MQNQIDKKIAGYHMLMILSAVDGIFNVAEDKIILEYLGENAELLKRLDEEMHVISSLDSDDYALHFNDAMNRFYMHSNESERVHFLDLATRLVAADKKISPRENLFLSELYNAWEQEIED